MGDGAVNKQSCKVKGKTRRKTATLPYEVHLNPLYEDKQLKNGLLKAYGERKAFNNGMAVYLLFSI